MLNKQSCRKRKRRPTLTPRFGSSTIAMEIGLLRMTLDMARQIQHEESGKERQGKKE